MRIALNAQAAAPGTNGIGQFARSALDALARSSNADTLLALRGSAPHGVEAPNVEEHFAHSSELWEQLVLPRVLERWAADVYFTPALVAPIASDTPSVVTLHDAIPLTHPALTTPEFSAFWARWLGPSLRAAHHIATVSEAAQKALVEQRVVEAAQVSVVRQAVSSRFRPHSPDELAPILGSQGLEFCGYALYLGSIEPRKNIAHLLRAYAAVDTDVPLVLAGQTTVADADIARLLASTPGVRHLGPVSDEMATALVAGARVVTFVSRAEGFGRPVLEAMASGVPVLASAIPAHLELAGEGALFASAEDIADLARQLERLLGDPSLRSTLRTRGLLRAAEFTPERFASDLRAIFARVVC